MAVRSAVACGTPTPGFNLPLTLSQALSRFLYGDGLQRFSTVTSGTNIAAFKASTPWEALWGDSNDGELNPVEPDLSTHDGRIPSKLTLPEIVADNDYVVPAGDLVLIGPDATAQERLDTHDFKEITGDEHAPFHARLSVGIGLEPEMSVAGGHETVEGAITIAQIGVVGV